MEIPLWYIVCGLLLSILFSCLIYCWMNAPVAELQRRQKYHEDKARQYYLANHVSHGGGDHPKEEKDC